MLLKLVVLCALCELAFSAKFPSDITKCKYSDSECIMKIINDIFANKSKGVPGLNLPKLDPLKIEKMHIDRDKQRPVNIALNFTNIEFKGLSKAKVYRANGFNQNPEGDKLDIRFKAPLITITGPYKINGKILILPIVGNGKTNMTLENLDIMLKFLTKKVENNGKIYMQIHKMKANFEVTRLNMHFTNLFNGDKALGDNMNLFLNQNWQEILNEIKPSLIAAFGQEFMKIINDVFVKIPYKDMFADE